MKFHFPPNRVAVIENRKVQMLTWMCRKAKPNIGAQISEIIMEIPQKAKNSFRYGLDIPLVINAQRK